MTTPILEEDIFIEFNRDLDTNFLKELIPEKICQFRKILKSYALFNVSFVLLMLAEIIYFFIHLALFVQTFVMAIHLALIFATLFCYFTLRMYIQTHKEEKLLRLQSSFIETSRRLMPFRDDVSSQLMIAQVCCQLAADLHGEEYRIYPCPSKCLFLSSSLEKLNCWLFWQDVHFIKESLLSACVDVYIKLVRLEPTNLEVHVGLANAYVMLSGLYVDPRTIEGLDDEAWIPPHKYNEEFKQKFRSTAVRAVEEFKILSDYAPHDPWVHMQLAYSYRDLQMPKEEIREYEIILQLCPDDKETLFKLGKLYFEQGQNAQGLKIYESLKRSHSKQAESLIHFYST